MCDREKSASTDARKRSRRTPSLSSGTEMVCTAMGDLAIWRSGDRRSTITRSRDCRCSSGFLRAFRLRCLRAGQIDQHGDGERREQQRDELGRREHEYRPALVAAEELDDEAGDRVEEHVEPERSSGERPPFALAEQQDHQYEQLCARLVELRRVQRHAERRPDVALRERIRERDPPRSGRRLAVAAAGKETAEAADDVTESNPGREYV